MTALGQGGNHVTSRHLRARLYREVETDVSLRVEDGETPDQFYVKGRGELHLSVLIETMRRQGYEFQVSRPEVIYKQVDGKLCEPVDRVQCDVPQAYAGAVIEKLGRRRGVLVSMHGQDRVRLEFLAPSRGLFGYRSEFLTDTKGEGVMSFGFESYEPVKGDIPHRTAGRLYATKRARLPNMPCMGRRRGARCLSPPNAGVWGHDFWAVQSYGRLGYQCMPPKACDKYSQHGKRRGQSAAYVGAQPEP